MDYKTIYIAEDGTEFEDKEKCIKYDVSKLEESALIRIGTTTEGYSEYILSKDKKMYHYFDGRYRSLGNEIDCEYLSRAFLESNIKKAKESIAKTEEEKKLADKKIKELEGIRELFLNEEKESEKGGFLEKLKD